MSTSRIDEAREQILHVVDKFNDTGRGLYQLSSSLKSWIAELIFQGASPDLCRQLQSYRAEIEVTDAVFIDSGNVDLLPEEIEESTTQSV